MTKIKFPIFFGIILSFVAVVVAEDFDWYYRFRFLDTVMHLMGGFIATWFIYGLYAKKLQFFSKTRVFFFLISVIFVIGWLWELIEYLSEVYSPVYFPLLAHYFGIGSFTDTLVDVFISDLLGGTLFYLICFHKISPTSKATIPNLAETSE